MNYANFCISPDISCKYKEVCIEHKQFYSPIECNGYSTKRISNGYSTKAISNGYTLILPKQFLEILSIPHQLLSILSNSYHTSNFPSLHILQHFSPTFLAEPRDKARERLFPFSDIQVRQSRGPSINHHG